ncbi:hypothetical protein AGR6A_Cc100034 [Agrobacterium sp. NCPPB 925]|nr:hypothetical protein AGR6A_Cc100034 [Agrobacterium sp. NCPPB 925]
MVPPMQSLDKRQQAIQIVQPPNIQHGDILLPKSCRGFRLGVEGEHSDRAVFFNVDAPLTAKLKVLFDELGTSRNFHTDSSRSS